MLKLRSKLPFFLSKALAPTPAEKEPIWVKYLESTGLQHIDTGVTIKSNNYRKEITLSNVGAGVGSNSPYAVMGTQSGVNRNPYLALNTAGKLGVGYAGQSGGASTLVFDNPTSEKTFILERKPDGFTFTDGDTTYTSSYTGNQDINNLSEWIFALNIPDAGTYSASVRVYGYRLYIDDVLVRDMRPCLHPVTNEPAMYDVIEKKYYYNQGTGTFKHGDILSQEPIWLEYIEANGHQYIDLDYIMTNMVGVRSEVVEQPTSISGFYSVFGFLGNLGDLAAQPRYGYSYYNGGYMFTFNQTPTQFDVYDNKHHLVVMYSNENYEQFGFVNGVAQKMNGTTFTDEFVADNTLSMYLFARNVNGTAGNNYFGKIYGFRHYDHTGALVMDLRPCLHPTTRRPAMYDVVRKRYFYNQGTGEFTYDETLMVLDYIETDGSSYINTGFAPTANMYFDLDFVTVAAGSSASLFGSRKGFLNQAYNIFGGRNDKNTTLRLDWGDGTYPNLYVDNDILVKFRTTPTELYINGALQKEFAQGQGNTYPLYLGAINTGGAKSSNNASLKIYKCKIRDGFILMRDYITVRTRAGKIGLWDFVTGKLYENAGTGVFKAYIGDIQLGSIQSDGTQYIDTGIVMKTMANCYIELASQSTYADTVFRTQLGFMKSSSEIMPRFGIADYSGSRMFSFNSTSATSDKVNTNTVVYKIKSDDEKIAAYVNGFERLSPPIFDTGFAENELTLWLFARNVAGAMNTPWSGKLYYFEYQDANTKHKMVPAKLADGRIGLWDFESKRLYENDGTGEFVFE